MQLTIMHGALLGVTKILLMLWFSPSMGNRERDFFIGDQVCNTLKISNEAYLTEKVLYSKLNNISILFISSLLQSNLYITALY